MMQVAPRTLRLSLIALGVTFGALVVTEVLMAVPDDTPQSRQAAEGIALRIAKLNPTNLDGMVADILARPLFSVERAPPDSPPPEVEDRPEDKAPVQLQRRLTGIMVRPGAREALFQRDGEKALAVKEGGEVDGWKVVSIEMDRVVLDSGAGEQTVKPTGGTGAAMLRAPRPKAPVAQIKPPAQARNAKPVKTAAAVRPQPLAIKPPDRRR
jgi:hypothetical protein